MKSVRQLITHTYIHTQCYNVNEKAYLFSRERESKKVHHSRAEKDDAQRDKVKQSTEKKRRWNGFVFIEIRRKMPVWHCENAQVCLIALNVDLICLRPEMGQYFIRATFNTRAQHKRTPYYIHIDCIARKLVFI